MLTTQSNSDVIALKIISNSLKSAKLTLKYLYVTLISFIYLTYFDGLYINYCTVYYLLLTLTGYILTTVLYTISYLL